MKVKSKKSLERSAEKKNRNTLLQTTKCSHRKFWLNFWDQMHKISTIKNVICTNLCVFFANIICQRTNTYGWEQSLFVQCVWILCVHYYLIFPTCFKMTPRRPIFFSLHICCTLTKALRAWKRMWCKWAKISEKTLSSWEWENTNTLWANGKQPLTKFQSNYLVD